jgi:hypothetical protein
MLLRDDCYLQWMSETCSLCLAFNLLKETGCIGFVEPWQHWNAFTAVQCLRLQQFYALGFDLDDQTTGGVLEMM